MSLNIHSSWPLLFLFVCFHQNLQYLTSVKLHSLALFINRHQKRTLTASLSTEAGRLLSACLPSILCVYNISHISVVTRHFVAFPHLGYTCASSSDDYNIDAHFCCLLMDCIYTLSQCPYVWPVRLVNNGAYRSGYNRVTYVT